MIMIAKLSFCLKNGLFLSVVYFLVNSLCLLVVYLIFDDKKPRKYVWHTFYNDDDDNNFDKTKI